ncbi:tRNA (guanine37-N1)-methyltransferase [Reichenbachiella faecimaris]|uniref:tRNA (guanine-N(1)-)-methyltransferase n=1 Tax=Reichenbachiella faecimaris TaxID=692418 RepID=A0A1W2GBB6_REIFA|nr:tRNA (guanosine(37)-N1)-methyltransferase TrmD [Reichenbachiella faecimaris]SMD33970.1 tRNA (guanine37-N1)-methyltransferase [Reichenbachiella faecimaris]
MRIDIITCVPAMFSGTIDQSILKRAADKGLAEIHVHDLRDFAINKHNQIDDYAFGGGAGMVLMIEPIDKCITKLKSERAYDEVIYMSPDGETLSQGVSNELSLKKNIILLCGHYKGVDERVREHLATREISIGDYVLTGGELAAAVVADSVIRLLPGVMNDETSALTDSFQDDLIAPPVYTRPAEYNNWKVPDVLTSGHQAKIEAWRFEQQVQRTKAKRPDLLKNPDSED